jgi:hypothetical protein
MITYDSLANLRTPTGEQYREIVDGVEPGTKRYVCQWRDRSEVAGHILKSCLRLTIEGKGPFKDGRDSYSFRNAVIIARGSR